MDSAIEKLLAIGSCEFDPVEKAGLSPAQTALMQPLSIVTRKFVDGNGLKIMFDMNYWLIAQMIKSLYKEDGSARTPDEIYEYTWDVV